LPRPQAGLEIAQGILSAHLPGLAHAAPHEVPKKVPEVGHALDLLQSTDVRGGAPWAGASRNRHAGGFSGVQEA
ncbi:hypothetical protein, partial [Thiococcus pfennigii]|uniref:hypothetical protein n=1 Tax=Thiococcus pfennigii TaxID=1057 RepID=UPI001A926130